MVRGVIAAATLSRSMRKSGYVSTSTHVPPTSPTSDLIHHEVGIEDDHFVARIDQRQHGQHQPAAGAAGDEHLAVGVAVLRRRRGACSFSRSAGDALRRRVAVLAARESPRTAACLNRLGHVEVGLADREVDRIVHRCRPGRTPCGCPSCRSTRIRSAIQGWVVIDDPDAEGAGQQEALARTAATALVTILFVPHRSGRVENFRHRAIRLTQDRQQQARVASSASATGGWPANQNVRHGCRRQTPRRSTRSRRTSFRGSPRRGSRVRPSRQARAELVAGRRFQDDRRARLFAADVRRQQSATIARRRPPRRARRPVGTPRRRRRSRCPKCAPLRSTVAHQRIEPTIDERFLDIDGASLPEHLQIGRAQHFAGGRRGQRAQLSQPEVRTPCRPRTAAGAAHETSVANGARYVSAAARSLESAAAALGTIRSAFEDLAHPVQPAGRRPGPARAAPQAQRHGVRLAAGIADPQGCVGLRTMRAAVSDATPSRRRPRSHGSRPLARHRRPRTATRPSSNVHRSPRARPAARRHSRGRATEPAPSAPQ